MEESFSSPDLFMSVAVEEGIDFTVWYVEDLVDNTLYYWRAKASDGEADSPWVNGNFAVNSVNDPPSAPTLKSPADMAYVDTKEPVLEVNPADAPPSLHF